MNVRRLTVLRPVRKIIYVSGTSIFRGAIVGTAICLSATLLHAQAAQDGSYAEGRTAYDAQQYSKAVSLLAKADIENPGKTDALFLEGKALAHLARLPEAERVLTKYLQSHRDSFEALEALGAVLQRENKPADSLKTFTRAAQLRTPSSADLNFVALDYVLLNDYTDAIHWLQKAVAFDTNNGHAWYDLGRCYYTQSRFPDAESAFERAQTLMSGDVRVSENLALTLDAENRPSAADRQYRKAVELARKNHSYGEWPYLNYGTFLLNQDRAAEAVPQLESAIAANSKCAECHAMLGRALAATGKITEGVHELEQAVTLAPNDPKAHYQLGRLYRQAGEQAQAKEQFTLSAKLYGSKSQSGHIQ